MQYNTDKIGNHTFPIPPLVSLDKQDFRAEGGQAKVFVQGHFAYKIYHDPKNCIPIKKMEELSVLQQDGIIIPLASVKNGKNIVGLVMQRVDHTFPLARLGAESFRVAHGIDTSLVVEVIRHIREKIAFIHSWGCLVVDINAMNFLLNEKTPTEVYCIDTDSYQTKHYPANAIVPSIRDYATSQFDEGTDWFSFGITACHLMLGLHPFRGNHPKYPMASLEDRIKYRASIFDKGVKLPPATRDVSVIPDDYREWFMEIFKNRHSIAAPGLSKKISVLISSAKKVIVRAWKIRLISGKEVTVTIDSGFLYIDGVASTVRVEKIFVVDNALYGWRGEIFAHVKLNELKPRIIASLGTVWRVLPHATTVLDGLLYQDMLGQPYLTVPFEPGVCRTLHIPEILRYKIVDGKYSNKIVELIVYRNGQYDRVQLYFQSRDKYTTKWDNDVDYK